MAIDTTAEPLKHRRTKIVATLEVGCTVVHGGVLEDRKGMNLPEVALSVGSLTDKDRADARFALDLGVDFLGLPFVRRAGAPGESAVAGRVALL